MLYTLGRGTPPPIPEDVEPHLDEVARSFLAQCFIMYVSSGIQLTGREPSERPTAAELLAHPFCTVPTNFSFDTSIIGRRASIEGDG